MDTSESTSNSSVADVLAGIEEGLAAAWVARDRSFIEAK
jgi:hypothetical protein